MTNYGMQRYEIRCFGTSVYEPTEVKAIDTARKMNARAIDRVDGRQVYPPLKVSSLPDGKDFGAGRLTFFPVAYGITEEGLLLDVSQVVVNGWFTAAQLRNISDELERQEAELKAKKGGE